MPAGAIGQLPSSASYGFYPAPTVYQPAGQPYAFPPAVQREKNDAEPPQEAATSVLADTVQRTAEAVAASAVAAAQAAASQGQAHSPPNTQEAAAQAQAYWPMPSGVLPMVPGVIPTAPGSMGMAMPAGVSAAAANPELWLQDEREVKRQRRKQSNRESARRSRLRKQAECDDLGTRATKLVEENEQLRAENDQFKLLIDQLTLEKQALLNQVKRMGMEPDQTAEKETVELPPPQTPPAAKEMQAQLSELSEQLVVVKEEQPEQAEAAPNAELVKAEPQKAEPCS